MLTDIIASGAMHSLKMVFQKKKERNVIIDPFSCLVKLSLIRYLDEGTKISIYQNRLNFNTPSYVQGIVRFMYGDNREDLHNILLPIQKCVEWYYDEKNIDMLYMFNNAVLGLKFLKHSYSTYATIQHTLDYYIIILMQKNTKLIAKMGFNSIDIEKLTYSILDETLTDKPSSDKAILDKPNTDKLDKLEKPNNEKNEKNEKKKKGGNSSILTEGVNEPVICDVITTDSKNAMQTQMQIQLRDIHKFLFELWNAREMNIVINLYRELENKQKGAERDYIYNNIMQYCEMKENKLYQYIEQNSSVL
jgi:hypothetical protein